MKASIKELLKSKENLDSSIKKEEWKNTKQMNNKKNFIKENDEMKNNEKKANCRPSSLAQSKVDRINSSQEDFPKLISQTLEFFTSFQDNFKQLKSKIDEIDDLLTEFFSKKIKLENNINFFYFDKKVLKGFDVNYKKVLKEMTEIEENIETDEKKLHNNISKNFGAEFSSKMIPKILSPKANNYSGSFFKEELKQSSKDTLQKNFNNTLPVKSQPVVNQTVLRQNRNKIKDLITVPEMIEDLLISCKANEEENLWEKDFLKFSNYTNISKLSGLEDYAGEYKSPKIKEMILKLSNHLPYMRKIRGDGNCFYRAIGTLFLEDLFKEVVTKENIKTQKGMKVLGRIFNKEIEIIKCQTEYDCANKDLFNKILDNEKIIREILIRFFCILWKTKIDFENKSILSEKSKNLSMIKFIVDLFNKYPLFDLSMTVLMRSMIYSFILRNKDNNEFKEFLFDINETLNTLKTFGLEAENIIIPISASVLNCNIIVNALHATTGLFEQRYEPKSNSKEIPSDLNLFFRPGHYDTLYQNYYEDLKNL